MEGTDDIDSFCASLFMHIELLNDIKTNFDYGEDYINGYSDACNAIKNTIATLHDQYKK